jgi:uncharacterized membrane protein
MEVFCLTKGKYGLCPGAAAVIAFIFAILNMPIPAVLMVGYAVLAEQSEWLTRQCLQALFLVLTGSFLKMVVGAVFGTLAGMIGEWSYELANFLYGASSVLSGLVSILVLVFAVIGILKTAKGNEASLPLFGSFAAKATGAVISKPKPAPAPAAPVPEAPVSAAPAAADVPAAPVQDGSWVCSCGKVNSGRFCTKCGRPQA